MAKFTSSTFGKISGKHGNVVAVTMKNGTSYFREHIIPPNPNTLKQQSQRGKFGFVVKELNCLRKVYTITFGGQYGINRAVALSIKTCLSGEGTNFTIDYSRLPIAMGHLALPARLDIEKQSETKFKLKWEFEPASSANPTDTVNVVLLNNSLKQVILLQHIAFRKEQSAELSLPDAWLNAEIHAWSYFSNSNDNHFSESKYLCLERTTEPATSITNK